MSQREFFSIKLSNLFYNFLTRSEESRDFCLFVCFNGFLSVCFVIICFQNFQIADKYPVGGYSAHQKLSRASQAQLQHGRSAAPGGKAEGKGLVHEHKENSSWSKPDHHHSLWSPPMPIDSM